FLLTAELWPLLRAAPSARVVTVASVAHRRGRIAFGNINRNHRYGFGSQAYAQSKLANLLFALELHRRIKTARSPVLSIAAHPGLAHTGLVATGRETGRNRARPQFQTRLLALAYRVMSQTQAA